MPKRYLTFTEVTNALDYLERARQFIREATTNDCAWKWVVIALHGALYGLAICACKGTDYHTVTHQTRRGDRRLISFQEALAACQDPQRMNMTCFSKPLVLTTDQKASIDKLHQALRNPFEHYVPTSWDIEMHGLPSIAIHCLEVIGFLALEVGNYTNLSGEQSAHTKALISEFTALLRSMPLHQKSLTNETTT